MPRKAKITKKYYEKFGWTEGCEACGRMRAGLSQRAHSEACRSRMEKELKNDEEGGKLLEEATQREVKFLERRVREDAEKDNVKGKIEGKMDVEGDGTNGMGGGDEKGDMNIGRIVEGASRAKVVPIRRVKVKRTKQK